MSLRITIHAVGRMKAGSEKELCDRYAKRLSASGKAIGWAFNGIVERPESRAPHPSERKADEAAQIRQRIDEGATIIVLDERGRPMGSEEFAGYLRDKADTDTDLAIIIGGPDGVDADLRSGADLVMSFGSMTMPHQIVRALVCEQLYRAATIVSGHPYHRA